MYKRQDRSHGERPDYISALTKILQETFDRGGNVVIPSFAVGRTQEMLYFLREIKSRGLVSGHGDFHVYVDSPLAVQATTVFNKNMYECFDEETLALVKACLLYTSNRSDRGGSARGAEILL